MSNTPRDEREEIIERALNLEPDAIAKLAEMEPTPFADVPDFALPRRRMTDAEIAVAARSLGVPEDELRREAANAWAESVRRGIVDG